MMGVSLEALQHVPLFVDWNNKEIQEIARLFNGIDSRKAKPSSRRARSGTPSF